MGSLENVAAKTAARNSFAPSGAKILVVSAANRETRTREPDGPFSLVVRGCATLRSARPHDPVCRHAPRPLRNPLCPRCRPLDFACGNQVSLATGTKLGPYEILAPLGAGGMGEPQLRGGSLKSEV